MLAVDYFRRPIIRQKDRLEHLLKELAVGEEGPIRASGNDRDKAGGLRVGDQVG